ncbi:MAG TPA: GNAT family N-acetyltransferase [Ktedonobacteraceae bacterium]|nr:GNAT family N-acetyltransferase [Ktedonobacteraceae bacterium]
MVTIRPMREDEAERVLVLWQHDGSEPLPEAAARQVLANLRQYASSQVARCFVAEEDQALSGFVTCVVRTHPIEPCSTGEVEELYVQPHEQRDKMRAALVRQAVRFLQAQNVVNIHTHICVGPDECPDEAEQRAFWQSLGWVNDMTIYSIYSSVPGDPQLQHAWDEYLMA